MALSLGSYLLGVGTVVGALAFGFGGGALLTKTAMKDTPAGPTRVERVAHSQPDPGASTPQKDVRENPAASAEPAPAARPDPAPANQAPANRAPANRAPANQTASPAATPQPAARTA